MGCQVSVCRHFSATKISSSVAPPTTSTDGRREGIRVSLGFFSDILIPRHGLQSGSVWSAEEKVWVWMWGENEMFMDDGETIRFRVTGVRFNAMPSGQVREPARKPTILT